jgi:hypothetical protein
MPVGHTLLMLRRRLDKCTPRTGKLQPGGPGLGQDNLSRGCCERRRQAQESISIWGYSNDVVHFVRLRSECITGLEQQQQAQACPAPLPAASSHIQPGCRSPSAGDTRPQPSCGSSSLPGPLAAAAAAAMAALPGPGPAASARAAACTRCTPACVCTST